MRCIDSHHMCLFFVVHDVVARNIREFEKTHEDVKQEVWIVGLVA